MLKFLLIATALFTLTSAANAQTVKENVENGMPPEHSNKLNSSPKIYGTSNLGYVPYSNPEPEQQNLDQITNDKKQSNIQEIKNNEEPVAVPDDSSTTTTITPAPQNGSEKKYEKNESSLKNLDDMQTNVTQHNGTEPAFNNAYWNFYRPGIYVDVVTGEPLFSSTDKYDAGNGWPSFHRPINDNFVSTRADNTLGMTRIEVRSKAGDSHLGHVFNDGPKDAGSQHYCINSAALRFVPVDEMKKQGYGEYLKLFGSAGGK